MKRLCHPFGKPCFTVVVHDGYYRDQHEYDVCIHNWGEDTTSTTTRRTGTRARDIRQDLKCLKSSPFETAASPHNVME